MAQTRTDLTHGVQGTPRVIDLDNEVVVHKLMTVRQVAAYLQMSTDFVYENANVKLIHRLNGWSASDRDAPVLADLL